MIIILHSPVPLPLLKEESINGGTGFSRITKLMVPPETAQPHTVLEPGLHEASNGLYSSIPILVTTFIPTLSPIYKDITNRS